MGKTGAQGRCLASPTAGAYAGQSVSASGGGNM